MEKELLYRALASPFGLSLRSSNSTLAKQRLYKARQDLGDPALGVLQIRQRPDGCLWITKAGAQSALTTTAGHQISDAAYRDTEKVASSEDGTRLPSSEDVRGPPSPLPATQEEVANKGEEDGTAKRPE